MLNRLHTFLLAALLLPFSPLHASDHADPVRLPMPWELLDDGKPQPKDVQKLTAGLTDLFIFPVDENDRTISFPQPNEKSLPFSPEERAKIATLTPAQRTELQMSPRNQRSEKLAALPPGDPAAVPMLNREDLARLERRTPQERSQLATLTEEQRATAKALVLILCVRPGLPSLQPAVPSLKLAPYIYKIHMDPDASVEFDTTSDSPDEIRRVYSDRARYGGSVRDSEKISPKISFTFQLNDNATLKSMTTTGLVNEEAKSRIVTFPSSVESGIRDDPFIFPPFFRTNVVAMAVKVPLECFPPNKRSWVLWAGSYRDGKKIDHDGRSLRTQQPRFARIFNEHEPNEQVAAFDRDRANPNLLRDLLVRFQVPALFNFRNWDRAPDVMIYNMAFDCRYPNGRLLTDDVAAELAENGDSLLLELSYVGNTWPRATANDKPFQAKFPFLAMPWTKEEAASKPLPGPPPIDADPVALSGRNKMILLVGTILIVAVLVGIGVVIGKWWARKKWRERYL